MEERIFNVEKLDFKNRITKDIILKIIAFFFFFSIILFSIKDNKFGIIQTIFAVFFLTIIVIITLKESIDYIYEVRIDSKNIKIYSLSQFLYRLNL